MKKLLQRYTYEYFKRSSQDSNDWAAGHVVRIKPKSLLDVGCNDGSFLFSYFGNYRPDRFCGVEANPDYTEKARQRGVEVSAFDLNGRWPYPNNTFDVVHASQVIEHMHNTRMFLEEARRVLIPGGWLIMISENLTSFLNLGAMIMGYVPFSINRACGWSLGNPFSLHYGEVQDDVANVPLDDPAFSGCSGHNRVLCTTQAHEFLCRVGFTEVEVASVGLMPIPMWLGLRLEKHMPRRGHHLLMRGRKPL